MSQSSILSRINLPHPHPHPAFECQEIDFQLANSNTHRWWCKQMSSPRSATNSPGQLCSEVDNNSNRRARRYACVSHLINKCATIVWHVSGIKSFHSLTSAACPSFVLIPPPAAGSKLFSYLCCATLIPHLKATNKFWPICSLARALSISISTSSILFTHNNFACKKKLFAISRHSNGCEANLFLWWWW